MQQGFLPGQDTSRLPGELKDMHSGPSASRVKHDAIEDPVITCSRPRGIPSLVAPVGPRGCLRDAEEGLGGEDPVPLDVGDVDEQAHEQAQRVRHLHHLQVPIIWYFSHFFVCEDCALAGRERQEKHIRLRTFRTSRKSLCSGTKHGTKSGLRFLL